MVRIIPNTREAYQLLHDGQIAFSRASYNGICVDVDYCKKRIALFERKMARLEAEFKSTKLYRHWENVFKEKTNIHSDTQLSYMLYNRLGLKPKKETDKGNPSVDEDTLMSLEMPELATRIRLEKYSKAVSTYLDGYIREQVGGVVHPFFNLHTTRTYRPSTDHPNLANVPIRDAELMEAVRQAIIPRKGHQLMEPDFSGIEVRIACIYTEDPRLIHDTLHGDMHKDMAIEIYMLDSLDKSTKWGYYLRQGGKNGFVFPQFYGDYYGNNVPLLLEWAKKAVFDDGTPALVHLADKGLIKLGRDGKIKNFDKFTDHVKGIEDDFWNVRYRVYTKWKKLTWEQYLRHGFVVMFTGFKMQGVMSKNQVLNGPIQGTAFHCLLRSFIDLMDASVQERWNTLLINQVYDSFLFDTDPGELHYVAKTVRKVACDDLREKWKWISVPLSVDIDVCDVDQPWSKKHKYVRPDNLPKVEGKEWPGLQLKREMALMQ